MRTPDIARRDAATTMALDLSRMLDPVLLARACEIEPDPWQARLLRERPRRALLCCSRQSGKTLTTVLLALWVAIYESPRAGLDLEPEPYGRAVRSFASS